MSRCKIITVANQKGGVAKTTTVRNLAYSLAELGYQVLIADDDPQSNSTASLVVEDENEDTPKIHITMANLMTMAMDGDELPPKSEYIHKYGKIDFIPNDIHLSVVEANLRMEMGSEKLLSSILEPLREDYDYILVDTNPSLGPLTINALSAADSVLITINPEFYATIGLQDLTKTILKVKRRINPKIEFEGILLAMCEMRTNLHKKICAEVNAAYGGSMRIFETFIPRTIDVGEANDRGLSILEYNPKSKAGLAYTEFAKELIGYGR